MERIKLLVVSENDTDTNHILIALSEQKDFIINSVKDEYGAIINSERLKPDVIIIDLKPSMINELELAAIIRRKTPSTHFILICKKIMNKNIVINKSINGFLHKDANTDEITFAIYAVLRGSLYISGPCMKYFAIDSIPDKNQPVSIPSSFSLTSRERNIITYLAKGFSDSEIAEQLKYNKGSIRNMVMFIKRKTKLKNRIQIVLFSIAFGLIKPKLQDLFKYFKDKENPDKA